MRDKQGLSRVASVYGILERIRAAELTMAHAAVHEAEAAAAQQRGAGEEADAAARTALLAGDRPAWSMAHVQREVSHQQAEKLRELAATRKIRATAADEVHRQSRQEKEQVSRICEHLHFAAQVLQARQVQAATDDRYLARRLWLSHKEADTPQP